MWWIIFFGAVLLGFTAIIVICLRGEEGRYGKKEKTETVLTEVDMAKITTVVKKAVLLEKGKKQVDIAQALDLIQKLDRVLDGCLYKLIRSKSECEIMAAYKKWL